MHNMNNRNVNYQKALDKFLETLKDKKEIPRLLLHSCCAPCSSYVLEYLSNYFEITVFYYNPNVFPEREYTKRLLEQQMLIADMKFKYPVSFIAGPYDREKFHQMAKGLEHIKEGGERCFKCYELRLKEAAEIALAGEFDYFATTLSISPLKNADKLNQIGMELEEKYHVKYLQTDFKKKNGYKRSIELSNQYGLYRQDYCGCEYSYKERQEQKNKMFKKNRQ